MVRWKCLPLAALDVARRALPQPAQNAAAAASMPPKAIEGPTMTVLTTDEEWATVHGDDCSDAVKGWLHAGLFRSGGAAGGSGHTSAAAGSQRAVGTATALAR